MSVSVTLPFINKLQRFLMFYFSASWTHLIRNSFTDVYWNRADSLVQLPKACMENIWESGRQTQVPRSDAFCLCIKVLSLQKHKLQWRWRQWQLNQTLFCLRGTETLALTNWDVLYTHWNLSVLGKTQQTLKHS